MAVRKAARAEFNGNDVRAAVATSRDDSYRRLLGEAAWHRLAPEIRARFSVKPGTNARIRYLGVMHRIELSLFGWLFAQACRLIGTPLAPFRGSNVPMTIDLVADKGMRGVAWQRRYHRAGGQDFVVRSTKCAANDGTFVEHIGAGFSMRLKLSVADKALKFRSVGYYVACWGIEVRIPDWLTPGVTTVTHRQLAGSEFRFTLSVTHPLLGRTIYQDGEFYSAVNAR